ncbi:MAG: dUTP diphosphatase [Firmicutes bacterium]|nr:dUTP diphosphatase [Bacillota bacterium]
MKIRGFEVVDKKHRKHTKKDINIPKRGSKAAAGYDFYTPESFTLKPGEKKIIWTDIKAYMGKNEVLKIYVRSSIGIKRGIVLSNGTGIIDADYYSNESNDGNIGIALHNVSDKEVTIEENERIAQGIFIPFLVADNGNSENTRVGGVGSTGEK